MSTSNQHPAQSAASLSAPAKNPALFVVRAKEMKLSVIEMAILHLLTKEKQLAPRERKILGMLTEGQHLSPREIEILGKIAEGKVLKEIAVELNLSTKTVETHCANVYRKINVHSQVEAANYYWDIVGRDYVNGKRAVLGNERDLTPRETEILGKLATGKGAKEIAVELDLSTKTVEVHRANINRKIGTHNPVQTANHYWTVVAPTLTKRTGESLPIHPGATSRGIMATSAARMPSG